MYQKGLLLGGFNPPHNGHFELMRAGLEKSEQVHILIGTRPKYQLTFEIRYQALKSGIEAEGLDSKVMIHYPRVPVFQLDLSKYDLLIMGSDIFNLLHPENQKLRAEDKSFFSKCNNLFIMEREGVPIDQVTLDYVKSRQNIEVYESRSPISSTMVRSAYRERKATDKLMPPSVKVVIDKYASLFETGY